MSFSTSRVAQLQTLSMDFPVYTYSASTRASGALKVVKDFHTANRDSCRNQLTSLSVLLWWEDLLVRLLCCTLPRLAGHKGPACLAFTCGFM